MPNKRNTKNDCLQAFFVFFLFDRAVLGAGGTCLARTEVERRCPSVQWHCG
ncbi:hypothetical protein ROSINTL182_08404 [Roseburia intestinalis L1-82]|uniref:Uncharacterized protein n=1 Tax=Roseburia intestinalis L1-82 TaxID=536231 RepID=C7GEQ2_9FIRM|nr:hypothetical protein ROSINTL182_08404 [Roseburia intestinalis L1-82]